MKKVLTVLVALAALAFATPVFAAPAGSTGWFVGTDAVYDGVTFSKTGKAFGLKSGALYGANLYGGYQLFEGISLEVGVSGAWGITSLRDFATSAGTQGVFVESTLRVPLEDWVDLDIVPAVTWNAAHINFGELGTVHDYSWGYRIGVGPEFTVGENVGLRAIVSYQQKGFHFTSGDVSGMLGVAWHI